MTRRVLTASIFLVGFVAIVAFVRAQDDSTHSVLKSIDAEADNPALSSPPSSSSSDSQLPLTTGDNSLVVGKDTSPFRFKVIVAED